MNPNGPTQGLIRSVPIKGGAAVVLASPSNESILAIDSTNVYFTDPLAGVVAVVALGGGPTNILAMNQPQPEKIQAGLSAIYFTLRGSPSQGSIVALSKVGGAPQTVVSLMSLVGSFVVDQDNLYGLDDAGELFAVPLAGGSVATLLKADAFALAERGAYIYVALLNGGGIVRIPKIGGMPETVATTAEQLRGIAVDDSYVYWSSFEGTVGKAPIAGGVMTVLAAGRLNPDSLAVDLTSVYWTEDVAAPCGAIYSVPK